MHELLFDLQLFSDGGADGSGADAAGANAEQIEGVTAADAAQQTGDAGEPAEEQDAAAQRKADYQKFKADYKAEFDAEVQNIMRRRLSKAEKAQKEAEAYHEQAERIMRVLKVKHGIDDLDELADAVEADDSYLEDEAIRRGMDVEALRDVQRTKWENEQLRAQQQQTEEERQLQEQVRKWQQWEADAKAIYPGFDLETEMGNPQFAQLANAGVDFKTAYQVAHLNDSLAGAMQYGAQETQRRMQQANLANQNRPDENALQSGKPMKPKIDIEGMTMQQLDDLIAQARRGKRITLQG